MDRNPVRSGRSNLNALRALRAGGFALAALAATFVTGACERDNRAQAGHVSMDSEAPMPPLTLATTIVRIDERPPSTFVYFPARFAAGDSPSDGNVGTFERD